MDSISEIIQTFSKDDIKEFKSFVNRQKKKKHRKDLELFNLLTTQPDIKPADATKTLYENSNTEAYYALRKKLTIHIMDYVMLKQLDNDTSAISGIIGMINLSRYLFENNTEQLAWKYLVKAEQQAISSEEYEQLNSIYNLQIEHFESSFAPPLKDLLKKHSGNKKKVEQNELANIAFSIIKEKLREVKISGKSIKFEEVIKQILEKYNLTNVFFTRPKLFYQVISIFRSCIVAKKDYHSFEHFIIGNYKQFNKVTGFQQKDIYYKASLLYMIAHTLYRNKKFKDSLKYLKQLEELHATMNKTDYSFFYPRSILLLAANEFFTGNITEAIATLNKNITSTTYKLNPEDQLNMLLNLGFYQLYNNEASKASKTIVKVFHSNSWCEKIMGLEWIMKKEMLEMLIQYDLQNFDIALNRIRSMERYYDIISKMDTFQRIKTFVAIIKDIINNPIEITSKNLVKRIDESFVWAPFEQEDLQAFLYYGWLKAKMNKKPTYEVLLELLKA